MTEKCPTCGRAIRQRKPKLSEHEKLRAKVRKLESASLRRPMPKATRYRE